MQLETSLADECSKQTLGAILREHISGNPAYTKGFIASNLFPTNVMQFKKNEVFVELEQFPKLKSLHISNSHSK